MAVVAGIIWGSVIGKRIPRGFSGHIISLADGPKVLGLLWGLSIRWFVWLGGKIARSLYVGGVGHWAVPVEYAVMSYWLKAGNGVMNGVL
jgi:hypothetical protein